MGRPWRPPGYFKMSALKISKAARKSSSPPSPRVVKSREKRFRARYLINQLSLFLLRRLALLFCFSSPHCMRKMEKSREVRKHKEREIGKLFSCPHGKPRIRYISYKYRY